MATESLVSREMKKKSDKPGLGKKVRLSATSLHGLSKSGQVCRDKNLQLWACIEHRFTSLIEKNSRQFFVWKKFEC